MTTTTISIEDLFRLAFEEPVTWLSEQVSTREPVNWIVTSLSEVQSGDILLCLPEQFEVEVLTQAQESKAGCVLILGVLDRPIGKLPENLPVAQAPSQRDVRATQRLLTTVLANQRAALMERGVRVHAQLSQLAAEAEGLEVIAHAIADISGRAVLVQDKRGNALAEYPCTDLSEIWGDVLKQLTNFEDLPEPLRDRKRAGKQAMMVIQDMPGGLARLITPITVGEVARGYLSLVGLTGELDALDHLVAEQGALVCAVEMARSKAIREAEKRLKGDLLTALLQENLSPRDARLWVQAMGLDLTQAHVALRFAWDAPSAPSRRRLETIVNGEISRQGTKVIVNPMGVEVVCFIQVAPDDARPALVLDLGQSVLEQALREYPDIPLRCGMGAPAQVLSDWRASFRQAGQALDLARRLGERKALYFPDLSVYRLLFQIEYNPELITFQEETIGPLLAYDGGEELIHTLEVYFEHNGNLTQTAEALFIHRNTLIYRMERIAEISGSDLNRPETRLAVQLALHIHRMLGTKRRS
jgi:purine catabolism regulator